VAISPRRNVSQRKDGSDDAVLALYQGTTLVGP
jgi:hypothetical protein